MFRKKEEPFNHLSRKRETDKLQGKKTEPGTAPLVQQRLEEEEGSLTGLVLVPGVKGCPSLVSFHLLGISQICRSSNYTTQFLKKKKKSEDKPQLLKREMSKEEIF